MSTTQLQPSHPPAIAESNHTNGYQQVFVQYILGALRESLARVHATDNLVSDAQRVQAWHVLSYALRVDEAWPAARELLLALAPKMEQAGFRGEWIAYLERGVDRGRALGDRHGEAELSLHVGHLHRLTSAFPQAEHWLAQSLQRFQQCDDQRGAARALNQLAYAAYLQHRYAEANDRVARAMALLAEDDAERAMSFFVLGMMAIDQGQWKRAEDHHRKSLKLRKKQGELRKTAWSLQNLGFSLLGQRKFAEAIEYFDAAINIMESTADLSNYAIANMSLGIAYYQSGESKKSLEVYAVAENIFRKLNDRLNLAKIQVNQGLSATSLQLWSHAESHFSRSADLFSRLNCEDERLNAMDGLCIVYINQHRYDEAIVTIEQALADLSTITSAPNYHYLLDSLTSKLVKAKEVKEDSEI